MSVIEMFKEHQAFIKQKYGVKSIGLFGSFARGDAKETSDVDVLVEFREGAENFDNYMELKYFLQEIFSKDVDLVTIDALRPQLKHDIMQEVVYA